MIALSRSRNASFAAPVSLRTLAMLSIFSAA